MKSISMIIALALSGVLISSAADVDNLQPLQQKVYGTSNRTTIAVTVAKDFEEEGIHYVAAGTKFKDFVKNFHFKKGVDPFSGIHLLRNGKKYSLGKWDTLELVEGDVIERTWINW